ncbi:hypothetical protein R1flu_001766 [Riccia fluitans]|uniref:BZIP domain-containing protein n=1 Tax=Riccia fluitans TaxID=41844 RepID=A0ABD1Y480_9MARC
MLAAGDDFHDHQGLGLPGSKFDCLDRSCGKKKKTTVASGVTDLPSSIGGGKPNDGRRHKRKMGRKKVCIERGIVNADSTGLPRSTSSKRKERYEDEDTGDSSPELDAARALTMFSQIIENRRPCQEKVFLSIRTESLAPLPHWSRKRRRSCREKTADWSSEVSHAKSEPSVEQQQSEAASSLGKDSHSAFNAVKVEALEQGCASDTEKRSNKLLSDSSGDFQHLDSREQSPTLPLATSDFQLVDFRGESPTSPLPTYVRREEVTAFAVFPKFEEGRSAFQKVLPIRPVKKLAVARIPKVEENSYEATTPEQAAVKVVPRKKPKLTSAGQFPVLKIEEADVTLTLGNPTTIPSLGSTRVENTKCGAPTAAAEEKPLPGPALIKFETKPLVIPGQRLGGKSKPAISESEKEARRQRRVQANRESARQTIRRKQVLCEELSAKSHLLSNENELLRQELKMKLMELQREEEISLHLKEQLVKSKERAAGSEFAPSPADKPVDGSPFKYPLPPVSFGQMHMPPMHPLFWYAYPQSAQAGGMQQGGDITLGLSANAIANFSMPPEYWVGLTQGGSQGGGQSSVLPHFFSHPSVVSGVMKFSSGAEQTTAPSTTSNPAVSLSGAQSERSFPPGGSGEETGSASVKFPGVYRSSVSPDGSSDANGRAMKLESVCDGLTPGSKPPCFAYTPPVTQAGMPASCMGSMLNRKASGEEMLGASSATAHLARASSGNLAPHVSKLPNSRYMFTSVGKRYQDMFGTELPTMMTTRKSPEAAAKAAEARRRRRELQRSRSLFHRQAARVAEPRVS